MAILGLLLVISVGAWAGVLHVPGDFASLTEAIAAANPGDEIRLSPGRYVGEFVLTKSVRIVGSGVGETLLSTLTMQPVILVADCEVELSHLTVSKGIGGFGEKGIHLQSGKLVLDHCIVRTHGSTGIQIGGGELELTHSVISGCRIGIWLLNAEAKLTALDTTFEGNTSEAVQIQEGWAQFERCTFVENDNGIAIDSGEVHVKESRFQGNRLAVVQFGGTISGQGNIFQENAQDVQGNVPPGFRAPRMVPTQNLVRFPSSDYTTLEEALEAVVPGGELVLESGYRAEARLTIDKEITIRSSGEEPATIFVSRRTPGRGPVLTLLSGSAVRLVGLAIEQEDWDPAVSLHGDALLHAEDCSIIGRVETLYGGVLELRDDSKASLVRCHLRGAEGQPVLLLLRDRAEAHVEDTVFEGYKEFGVEARDESWVRGANSRFLGPGVALGGRVDPGLRLKLHEAEREKVIWPSEEYPDLQAAIDALLPGGTLVLTPGTYEASVVLDKDIVVIGASPDSTILTPSTPDAPVFSVLPGTKAEIREVGIHGESRGILGGPGSQIKLSDCEQRITGGEFGSYALQLNGDAQATILNCRFSGDKSVVFLTDASSLYVANSRFHVSMPYVINAETAGSLRIEGSYFTNTGLDLEVKGESYVTDCAFTDSPYGLRLKGRDFLIARCRFLGGKTGLEVWGVEQAVVEDCEFAGLEQAIYFGKGNRLELKRCSIRGTTESAIQLDEETMLVVEESSITHCAHGIVISGGTAQIKRTQISANRGSGLVVLYGELALVDSTVERNQAYGIYLHRDHSMRPVRVTGSGNVIRDNGWDVFPPDAVGEGFMEIPPPTELVSLIRLPSPKYPSLKEAIRSLLPGGTIILGEGEYTGLLYVDREMTIRAEEGARPVIVAPPSREHWEGEELLQDCWLPYACLPAIIVADEGHLRMEGVEVFGGRSGVVVMGTGQAELINLKIEKSLYGLLLSDTAHLSARQSQIEPGWLGVIAYGSSVLTLQDVSILGPGLTQEQVGEEGLALIETASALLSHCRIAGFNAGILLTDRASLSMSHSVVEHNTLGMATYTQDCFPSYIGTRPFTGTLTGSNNMLRDNTTDFCPPFPGPPWPEDFLGK